MADDELAEYRERLGRYPSSSFHYHYARLIEILHCIDMIEQLLQPPDILDTARAGPCRTSTASRASAWPRRRAAR